MVQFNLKSVASAITLCAVVGTDKAMASSPLEPQNVALVSETAPAGTAFNVTSPHENNIQPPNDSEDNRYENNKAFYNFAEEADRLQNNASLHMKQWAESITYVVRTMYHKNTIPKESALKTFSTYVIYGSLEDDPVYDELARLFWHWKENGNEVYTGPDLVRHLKPYHHNGH